MSIATSTTEVEIWDRVIRPEIGDFSVAAAHEFLRLKLSASDLDRVRLLSAKANDGALNDDEARELDHYLNVGRTLELIKAKSRLSLRGALA